MFNKKQKYIQIAIDGPAGSGKTTIANQLSKTLNIKYLSTGFIFRTYASVMLDIDANDIDEIKKRLKQNKFEFKNDQCYVNGIDVTDNLQQQNIGNQASAISKHPYVRRKYEKDVRKMTKNMNVIMDGRDIGTVILPKAKYKFFMVASVDTRAKRRWLQLNKKQDLEEIRKQIIERDYADSNREHSPLKKAKDAIEVDTSNQTVEQTLDTILKIIRGA